MTVLRPRLRACLWRDAVAGAPIERAVRRPAAGATANSAQPGLADRGRTECGLADRGSAGIWVLALSGVLLLAGTASVLTGLAIISRHQAGTAADLAALAAASQALSGSEVACARAVEIAEANGAVLESCSLLADGVVDVTVTVSVELGSLGIGVARAMARAGPAEVEEVPLPGPGDP